MDEGHYFNDPERGYVWEQSIIGLDPRDAARDPVGDGRPSRAVLPVGRRHAARADGARSSRASARSRSYHEFREEMLIDTVRELAHAGDVPGDHLRVRPRAVLRGRARSSSRAGGSRPTRRRRTHRGAVRRGAAAERRCAKELRPLLAHGIGIHHAGILPRYKQLVEQLALERLVKFVVSTETIAAGINLPAQAPWCFRRCASSSSSKARLVTVGRVPPDGRPRRPAAVRRQGTRDHARARGGRAASSARSSRTRRSGPAYDEEKVKKTRLRRARAAEAQKNGRRHLDAGGRTPALVARRARRAAQQDARSPPSRCSRSACPIWPRSRRGGGRLQR